MVQLPKHLHEKIKAHGEAAYPYEGCGLLLGQMENGRNVITTILPMRNVWPDEEEQRVRFRIDPDDWRDAEFAAMSEGLDIIGVFHSHPDHEPAASPRDLAWASWPGYSYIITEIRDGRAAHSRSWLLSDDRSGFIEERIEIGD